MTAPVRVLHAAQTLGLGGTEKVMQLLAAYLDGHRFHAAIHSPVDGERGIQLRALGVPTYVGMDLLDALSRFRPHILHLHRAGWPQPSSLRAARAANIPCILETNVFGRHDPSPGGSAIDVHLFVSRFCLERLRTLEVPDAAPPRYDVLHNPVDTDFFAAACPAERDRPMAVGRLARPDPGKWSALATVWLPEAAKAVPGMRYRIIGALPEARDFAAAHGLDHALDCLPPAHTDADLAAFFNSISVLAHANDTGESFGLAIAEAMAAGLPVVTHPSPWPKDNAQLELVEHGVTGLVAETPEAYARAVVRLLENPEEARAMGEAGRRKAAALFRVQDQAARLAEIYDALLCRKGVTP